MMFTINISICTIFGSLLEITNSNKDIKILTNTQVVQSANSSGSIKQLKWFSQRVQTSLLADADVSISLQIRLR